MRSQTLETSPTELKLHGRVKWFNTKKSYGFIIVSTESEWKGTEIFVHHSAICVGVKIFEARVFSKSKLASSALFR